MIRPPRVGGSIALTGEGPMKVPLFLSLVAFSDALPGVSDALVLSLAAGPVGAAVAALARSGFAERRDAADEAR